MAALHCVNPFREESPAQRKVEQQQYRTSLNQLFVQHKCTVLFKMNEGTRIRVRTGAGMSDFTDVGAVVGQGTLGGALSPGQDTKTVYALAPNPTSIAKQ